MSKKKEEFRPIVFFLLYLFTKQFCICSFKLILLEIIKKKIENSTGTLQRIFHIYLQ